MYSNCSKCTANAVVIGSSPVVLQNMRRIAQLVEHCYKGSDVKYSLHAATYILLREPDVAGSSPASPHNRI